MDKNSEVYQANQFVLNNPGQASKGDLVTNLAQQDPDLNFFCPLSLAFYLLNENSCTPYEASDALESCWLIDESAIHKEDTWEQGDNIEATEVVEHSIQAHLGGNIFTIGFLSEANLLFCPDQHKQLFTYDKLFTIFSKPCFSEALNNPARLADLIASRVKPPIGLPEGEDEPLCGINHQLVSINGSTVEGPKMYNGYHDVEIEDFSTSWDGHLKPECLNWLHAVNEQLAIKLGLSKSTTTDSKKNPESTKPFSWPSWLREDLDIESAWIDAETLSESYSRGNRLRDPKAPYYLALGSGEEWFPGICDEDEEICDASTIRFPSSHPPILKIEISPESKKFPVAVERLRPYLLQLAEIANGG